MIPPILCRHDLTLAPESSRVIIRPFIPGDASRVTKIIGRALALSEDEIARELAEVLAEFNDRHFDIKAVLLLHFEKIKAHVFTERPLSRELKLLLGAIFSGEYALESAALFNPSIVPHPDQSGLPEGALRFVMSLRATGEGHISSIEFRSGVIAADGCIELDPVSRFVTAPEILPNPTYRKSLFLIKLNEMLEESDYCAVVMDPLQESFTLSQLQDEIARVRDQINPVTAELSRTLERIQWLAESNYELSFPESLSMSERIIFPVSSNESNGIEDARFVRFVEDDGSVIYYATYTAYNGHSILPQLIETGISSISASSPSMAEPCRTRAWPSSRAGRRPVHDALPPGRREPASHEIGQPPPLGESGGADAPEGNVGVGENRQLRLADRDRGRLARHHPRRGADAQVLHRRRAAGSRRSLTSHRPDARAPDRTRGKRARRLRPERRL
jgi:hypothetical protein